MQSRPTEIETQTNARSQNRSDSIDRNPRSRAHPETTTRALLTRSKPRTERSEPRHDLRVLRVSAGTSPIGTKAGSDHDDDMEVIVEEIIRTYIGPYASPGLLLAAAVSIIVLVTGLGARIVELGQAVRLVIDSAIGRLSPLTPRLIAGHARDGE